MSRHKLSSCRVGQTVRSCVENLLSPMLRERRRRAGKLWSEIVTMWCPKSSRDSYAAHASCGGRKGGSALRPCPLRLELLEQPVLLAFGAPLLNFAGQGQTGSMPPDTVGDLGVFHYYVEAVNAPGGSEVAIYNTADASVGAELFSDGITGVPGRVHRPWKARAHTKRRGLLTGGSFSPCALGRLAHGGPPLPERNKGPVYRSDEHSRSH